MVCVCVSLCVCVCVHVSYPIRGPEQKFLIVLSLWLLLYCKTCFAGTAAFLLGFGWDNAILPRSLKSLHGFLGGTRAFLLGFSVAQWCMCVFLTQAETQNKVSFWSLGSVRNYKTPGMRASVLIPSYQITTRGGGVVFVGGLEGSFLPQPMPPCSTNASMFAMHAKDKTFQKKT